MKTFLRLEKWGYSIWQNGKQIVAGIGINPEKMRPEFNYSTRAFRKHGIAYPL